MKPGDVAGTAPPLFEVRFPVRARNHLFKVTRENVVDMLPEFREIDFLKRIARSGVAEFMSLPAAACGPRRERSLDAVTARGPPADP
jgi:hypothetical protein